MSSDKKPYDLRDPTQNPNTLRSDYDVTTLQNGLVYFLTAVIKNKFEKIVRIQPQRGGWEKWFQVELCLLINHFHDRDDVHPVRYHATREKRVYDEDGKSVDVVISEGETLEKSKRTHVLEIKCGKHNQSTNDIAKDIWEDWGKLGAITGNGNGTLQPGLAATSRVAVCVTVNSLPTLTGDWHRYTFKRDVDGKNYLVHLQFRYLTRY
ncbi:unnamed protein product [Mycena citricolor]|uniref:Uncharacterized protein n=1 Tax=Mycena citricolor TaxID=2018698 RepID=A0AAD2JW94_9AGAR|nr:unnamed protein product [Mycena citricolor]